MVRIIIMALLVATSAALSARAEGSATAAYDNRPQEIDGFARLLEKLRQHSEIASLQAKTKSSEHYAKGELGLSDAMLFVEEQDYALDSITSQMQEERILGNYPKTSCLGIGLIHSAVLGKTGEERNHDLFT